MHNWLVRCAYIHVRALAFDQCMKGSACMLDQRKLSSTVLVGSDVQCLLDCRMQQLSVLLAVLLACNCGDSSLLAGYLVACTRQGTASK